MGGGGGFGFCGHGFVYAQLLRATMRNYRSSGAIAIIDKIYFTRGGLALLLSMSWISPTFRTEIDGQAWVLSMRWSWKRDSYTYTITVDGEVVKQREIGTHFAQFTEVRTFLFAHRDIPYRVGFAPISIWRYGAHIYRDGVCVYKFKGRDFVAVPGFKGQLEALDRNIAKQEAKTAAEQARPKKKTIPLWGLILMGIIAAGVTDFMTANTRLSDIWWAQLAIIMAIMMAVICAIEAYLNRPKASDHVE